MDRVIDLRGINLLRIVIGSYFLALAMGLIQGVDKAALFVAFADATTAQVLGSALLLYFSLTFMAGIAVRMSALVLALFVFCSSAVQTFLYADPVGMGAFWRDLALVCGVLLSYAGLGRRDLRRIDLLHRRARPRHIAVREGHVTPRRMSAAQNHTPRPGTGLRLAPLQLRDNSADTALSNPDNIFADV
ncbi:hypothetical protein [Roseovarius salinarum]|uniref:hypothetical protein n=1 Tax=Roseovarius salinarum TaxID=1981892 RepID=UPI001E35758F|nr:hypothetical protein [Roseovarius salinarum]